MGCCSSKGGASIERRSAKWKATGIFGLRDSQLKAIPTSVLELEDLVRTLDASQNKLVELPLDVGRLSNLQRLMLAENALTRLPSSFGRLRSLKLLALDSNRLTELPEDVGLLVRLERLSVARNMLSSLPSSLGSLRNLFFLDVSHNKLKSLPTSVGSCFSLEELLATGNSITDLPQSLSSLKKLKTLALSENKISKLPELLLKDCISLRTLTLHGNPLTMDMLEQMEGFDDYEARRRKKINKQLDHNVVTNSNLLDEGVDRKK